MEYLILVTVQADELESYLKSWNSQDIPEVKIIQGPYVSYQSIEGSQSIIIIETEKLGKAEQFCKSLQYTESIKLTPIMDDKKTIEELEDRIRVINRGGHLRHESRLGGDTHDITAR